MNKLSKGFTLIELLVVIAIIGVLSGILIVSMSGATNAAKDARIKADLDELRSVAQLYATNNPTTGFGTIATGALSNCNSIASTFMSQTDAQNLCTDIYNQNTANYITVYSSASAYCISKALVSGGTWCVDSKGNAGAPAGSCDGTNYDCL